MPLAGLRVTGGGFQRQMREAAGGAKVPQWLLPDDALGTVMCGAENEGRGAA